MIIWPFHTNKNSKEKSTAESLQRLQQVILNTLDYEEVVKNSVNSVLTELGYMDLGYKIIVLALVNKEKKLLERIAISETEEARHALKITPVPFHEINIPLSDINNLSIESINNKKSSYTTDWYDILRPAYNKEEALAVQKAIGIKTSMVYPIFARGKPLGVLIFSMVKNYDEVSEKEKDLLNSFTDLVGLALQNSLLYASLDKASSELAQANLKLQQLDKLKDDFVSIASHELRTPMTAIKSYLWMALYKGDINLTEKMKKYLGRAYISTERLINLVNDMLNVSRIESGRIEISSKPFDMLNLVTEVLEEVKPKADEKQVRLEAAQEKIPQVLADPDKVHQVLLNLVGNALKFTPQDGLISINFFTDGQVVEVAVKDSGVGINPDDLSQLFQKFGRLDSSYIAAATSGGTGLGLYISKSLIDLMKGKIWAKSEGMGKGTTFTFSLPVATPALIAEASKAPKKPIGEVKPLEPVAI